MATHLIIDGYNLLGVRGQVGPDSESARERLLRDLSAYRQRKGHPITVVFDGWQQGMGAERREHRAGVQVVYSRRGERADQVIQRLVEEFGLDCAVVSSDREVADFAKSRGAFVMGSSEFDTRLRVALTGAARFILKQTYVEDDLPRRGQEKKGNARRLPKALRKRNRQLRAF
ncbi:MAG TPA: NYN domain-containing protein [Nitrospiraceae bacterium]|nr:NYN domain-containing protein [Nitrospiraceae bacterium]